METNTLINYKAIGEQAASLAWDRYVFVSKSTGAVRLFPEDREADGIFFAKNGIRTCKTPYSRLYCYYKTEGKFT